MKNRTPNPNEVNKLIKDVEKAREKEIKDLKSRSKQLHELVATENFTINEVIAESYVTSFTPDSEIRMGPNSPVYRGGFTSRLVLKVSPDNRDIPVRTLTFNGFSVVKAGDYVSAQIPRYEEKTRYLMDRALYLDRDFNPEESAIELAILSTNGKVLRRDRAVNYETFVKE